jgi:PAS domain S-box-containing protein
MNYQSKSKEELIAELEELQQRVDALKIYCDKSINERKRAEHALLKNEKRMRTIFESMNEGFSIQEVICDETGKPRDLRFVDANTAFERQTGLKNADTLGRTLLELFPQSESYWIERYANVGLTGEPIQFEAMLGPQDIYYKVNAFQTEFGRLGVMYTEITGRMLAEQELLLAEEHAEESERLKSAILANMSHEIRTPMNGILGFAELLKEPDLTDEEQQKYISIIEKSGARMLNIINDIDNISNIESGTTKVSISSTNINEQIELIYTLFKSEIETKGIRFSFKNTLTDYKAIIQTDREKIKAILTYLVKNALKFTNEGSIEFGYNFVETHGHASLQFFVKDTGIGIPKEMHEAIFESFIQADIEDIMARHGAGLGLTITKAYVEMLGGKIWVESEEGKGSTFYFTLPYLSEPIETEIVANAIPIKKVENQPNTEISGLKILIAEDDEASEMLIAIVVKMLGREIIKVRTGAGAVDACRKNPDIDLVLMDIQMPGMDGYEATQQIRQFNQEVIIIAQTAFGLSGDREKSIQAGCNDYIAKPINKEKLQTLIQKHFIRH